jgi:hypothetical protein
MQNKTKIIRDIFAAYMSNDRKAVEDAVRWAPQLAHNYLRNNFVGHVGAAKPGSSC